MPGKILFIAQDGLDLPTARVRCYRFAEYLARRGWVTRVLSFRDHLGASRHGAELPEMPWSEKMVLNLRALNRIARYGRSILYLQKINYHSFAPFLASRLGRMPLVVDYDDYEYLEDRPRSVQSRIVRGVLSAADFCVTGSHFLHEWLGQYNRRVIYIPTGVDGERFTSASLDQRQDSYLHSPTLIWAGVVFDDSTLRIGDFLLEVFQRLAADHGTVRLILLLMGKRAREIETRVCSHPSRQRITIKYDIAPDEVSQWLTQAHFGLFHFPEVTTWVKSKSPTKVFEYMACGLVPVCRRGTEGDYILEEGRSGLFFDGVSDCVAKLRHLLDDFPEWRSMSIEAERSVRERFTLEVLAERLDEALASLRN